MRFVDASVFVHAYIKPKRNLSAEETTIKENAKQIVTRINNGEQVLTSVVHLAEIANLLEDYMPLDQALDIEQALCLRDTIEIAPVAKLDCLEALDEVEKQKVGLSDALAYILMKKNGASEIYSFDHDFDRLQGTRRISR